jgi:hypothetical protein
MEDLASAFCPVSIRSRLKASRIVAYILYFKTCYDLLLPNICLLIIRLTAWHHLFICCNPITNANETAPLNNQNLY